MDNPIPIKRFKLPGFVLFLVGMILSCVGVVLSQIVSADGQVGLETGDLALVLIVCGAIAVIGSIIFIIYIVGSQF